MEGDKFEAVGGQLGTQLFLPERIVGSNSQFFSFSYRFRTTGQGVRPGPGRTVSWLVCTELPGPGLASLGAKGLVPLPGQSQSLELIAGWCEPGNVNQLVVKYKELTTMGRRFWCTIFFRFRLPCSPFLIRF